jgi:ABC-type antimicrobial peptide transport system permease subunit
VNRSFARRLALGENPVGTRFRIQESSPDGAVFEIIGLVEDTKYGSLREDPRPIVFMPIGSAQDQRSFTDMVIRTAMPLADLSSTVTTALALGGPFVDADIRLFDATIRNGLLRERLLAAVSSVFGALGALIATIGLYGVVSYLVLRRMNELGVRLALGAQRRQIVTMVLGEAARLLAAGLAIGTVAALAVAGVAGSLVFGLRPYDAGTIALACVLLGTTAMAAASIPACRAARLPLLTALRGEE